MSTVSEWTKCPQCHNPESLFSEFDCHKLCYADICTNCGYEYKEELRKVKGRKTYEVIGKEMKGYGVYKIEVDNGCSKIGGFSKPVSKKIISEFEKLKKDKNITGLFLSRWNDKTNTLDVIIDWQKVKN